MNANYQNVFEFLDLLLKKIEGIEKILSDKNDKYEHKEYMGIDELLEYLQECGIQVSKSRLYKVTCTSGGIPFRRLYGRLIFSKQEIDLWLDYQLNSDKKKITDGAKATSKRNNKNIANKFKIK